MQLCGDVAIGSGQSCQDASVYVVELTTLHASQSSAPGMQTRICAHAGTHYQAMAQDMEHTYEVAQRQRVHRTGGLR